MEFGWLKKKHSFQESVALAACTFVWSIAVACGDDIFATSVVWVLSQTNRFFSLNMFPQMGCLSFSATTACGGSSKERSAIQKTSVQIHSTHSCQPRQSNLSCPQTKAMISPTCNADHPQHWWVNQSWKATTPDTKSRWTLMCATFAKMNIDVCNVCLADVWLETLWRPTKKRLFPFYFEETIPLIYYNSDTLCCLLW